MTHTHSHKGKSQACDFLDLAGYCIGVDVLLLDTRRFRCFGLKELISLGRCNVHFIQALNWRNW